MLEKVKNFFNLFLYNLYLYYFENCSIFDFFIFFGIFNLKH